MFKRYMPFLLLDPGAGGNPAGQQDGQNWQKQYEDLKALTESQSFLDDLFKKAEDAGKIFSAARFTGLSRTLSAMTEERDGLKNTLATKENELLASTNDLKNAKDALSAFEAEKSDLIKAKDGLQASLDAYKKRIALIHEKFPTLEKFEHAGLLPHDDDMTALEQKLGVFVTTLGDQAKQAISDFAKGGMNPPPPIDDKTPKKSADLLKEANQAFTNGETKTYREKYDQYLDALKKESV